MELTVFHLSLCQPVSASQICKLKFRPVQLNCSVYCTSMNDVIKKNVAPNETPACFRGVVVAQLE